MAEMQLDPRYERQLRNIENAVDRLSEGMQRRVYGHGCLAAARVLLTRLKSTNAFRDRTGRTRGSMRAEPRTYKYRDAKGNEVEVPNASAQVAMAGTATFLAKGTVRDGKQIISPTRFVSKALETSKVPMLAAYIAAARRRLDVAVRYARR